MQPYAPRGLFVRVLLYSLDTRIPSFDRGDSKFYRISRHLVRVVQTLSANSFVKVSTGRGRRRGFGAIPAPINLGGVVRGAEPLSHCGVLDMATDTCTIAWISGCGVLFIPGAGIVF